MDKKALLEHRKNIKTKKPVFLQSSVKIKARLAKVWRKPKGLQNKMRLNKKGYPRVVQHGYGSPSLVKNLDYKTGLLPIIIATKKDLDKIDIKTQGIIIKSTVGMKKRLDIIKLAEEKKIIILQDVNKMKNKCDTIIKLKKERREKILERKKTKVKKQKKASEVKKEKEKKEADKTNDTQAIKNAKVLTDKAKEADKANKEILQKRI